MKPKIFLPLIISILIAELAGVIGALFTSPSIPTWYAGIIKPALNPPSWIFGPVWTALFVLMGIAVFLVWRNGSKRKDVNITLTIYGIQLGLNMLWSMLFFGLQNPLAAFIEIFFLWLAILATIVLFYRMSKPAAYLLVPYILWVSFAMYLNYSIVVLN